MPTTTTDLSTAVAKIRKLNADMRTMQRNLRLGHYQGRNNGGDTAFKQREVDELFETLPRNLQGMLTAEHKLASRISENADNGNPRFELRARLALTRQDIKNAVKETR